MKELITKIMVELWYLKPKMTFQFTPSLLLPTLYNYSTTSTYINIVIILRVSYTSNKETFKHYDLKLHVLSDVNF